MTWKVGGEGEKCHSFLQGLHQPYHDYYLAYGGEEGSDAAVSGGNGNCYPWRGGQLGCYDHNENVGLPTSGPAEILVKALHPGG